MEGSTYPSGDPWAGAGPREDRQSGYDRAVDRLMADYQPSYEPGAAEDEWRLAPGGENDPYGGPFYQTAAEAAEAAGRHRADAWAAADGLERAIPLEQAARADLERLRGELRAARPWQRRRRAELREQIADADSRHEERSGDVERFLSVAEFSAGRYDDAAWVAGALRRSERAGRAAGDAVARTLGWQPGLPGEAPRRPPRPGTRSAHVVRGPASQARPETPVTRGHRRRPEHGEPGGPPLIRPSPPSADPAAPQPRL